MDKKRIALITSLLVLLIIVSALSFILGKETTITTMAVAELEKEETCPKPQSSEFRAYTQAFCEEKDFYRDCKDILVVECGNTKHKIPIVNGSAEAELV